MVAKIKFHGILQCSAATSATAAAAGFPGVVFAEGPSAVLEEHAQEGSVKQSAGRLWNVSSGVIRLPGIKDPHKTDAVCGGGVCP
jgi:hypothetical protein